MDGGIVSGIGEATTEIASSVAETAGTVETIGTEAVETTSSIMETPVSVSNETGEAPANLLLNNSITNGTDRAFDNLANADVTVKRLDEVFDKHTNVPENVIPINEKAAKELYEEHSNKETIAPEVTSGDLEPGEELDLTHEESEVAETVVPIEEMSPEEFYEHIKGKSTEDLVGLRENLKKKIKQIQEELGEEEEKKKKISLLEILLAILVGSVIAAEDEAKTQTKRAA